MLTLKQITDDKAAIIAGLEKKHFADAANAVNAVWQYSEERKAAQQKKDAASAEMNKIAKSIGQLMAQGKKDEAEDAKKHTGTLKQDIAKYEKEMTEAEKKQTDALLQIPNVPYSVVPEGKGAEDNRAVKTGGFDIPQDALKKMQGWESDGIALKDWDNSWNPQPEQARLPHWDLAKEYNLIDFDLGVKISGAGFPVYIGQGARLQRALINFFLAEAAKAGYTEIMPPTVVNQDSGYGTGQLPDKEGQMYH